MTVSRCLAGAAALVLLLPTSAVGETIDFTAPVLLFSDAPELLRQACPALASPGADCRIEQVTARHEGGDWLGEAKVKVYRDNGEPGGDIALSARLDGESCALLDRRVMPASAVGNRLLTITERQIRRARADPEGMARFCLLLQGLVEERRIPDCLCRR